MAHATLALIAAIATIFFSKESEQAREHFFYENEIYKINSSKEKNATAAYYAIMRQGFDIDKSIIKNYKIDSVLYCVYKDIGDVAVIKCRLDMNHLPAMMHFYSEFTVVVSYEKMSFFFIFSQKLFLVKDSANGSFQLGVIHAYKGEGFFKVYAYKKSKLYVIFHSDKPVANYSHSCTRYKDRYLHMKNVDVNNDGFLDIVFHGIKFSYHCIGEEVVYANDTNQPIKEKEEEVTYTYLYSQEIRNWVPE